jgi:hypothetical protein
MRFLKRQTINRRQIKATTVYSDVSDANVFINPRNSGSLALPQGTDAQIPSSAVNGMMRYNVDHGEVQVYQSNKWRSLKFKESSPIIQQSLGAGDSSTVYFGPLNPAYNPTNISSNVPLSGGQSVGQFGGQNILVIVENVLQIYNTNYTIEQNPTIGGEIYSPVSSATANVGDNTIYFSTSLPVTGCSGTAGTATLTFATQFANPFYVGGTIIVSGMTPTAYNGSWTVTGVSTSSVSFASSATGSMVFPGTVTSQDAVYPAVNITGATLSGNTSLQSNTHIVSYAVDPVTDALISITLDKTIVTSNISAGSGITITESAQSGTGYYLKFSSAVPYGKIVTALIGFDQ